MSMSFCKEFVLSVVLSLDEMPLSLSFLLIHTSKGISLVESSWFVFV